MTHKPYENAIEYLEDELTKYLPIRASRIGYERQIKDLSSQSADEHTVGEKQPVAIKEAERQVVLHREKEDQLRSEIDSRLEITRLDQKSDSKFSVDQLADDFDYEARLILLALTSTALGMGDTTFNDLGTSFYGSAHVDDLVAFLDVKTVTDRLRVRRLLHDMAGLGLIVLDFHSKKILPEDFNTIQVSLSPRTFAVILDDPSLETECVIPSKDSH